MSGSFRQGGRQTLLLLLIIFLLLSGCSRETVFFELTIEETGGGIVMWEEDGVWIEIEGSTAIERGSIVVLKAVPGEGFALQDWEVTGSAFAREEEKITFISFGADTTVRGIFAVKTEPSGFAGGDGSETNPFLVGNATQLDNVRNYLEAHFLQIADIDLTPYSSGAGWDPIGEALEDCEFMGVYNGASFSIGNLYIHRPESSWIGLFAFAASNSRIENVKLEEAEITGRDRVGGLVGQGHRGTIENCIVSGKITGRERVGGITGHNNSQIKGTVFVGTVSGEKQVGGLVGFNREEISYSVVLGEITATAEIAGGLVGENSVFGTLVVGTIIKSDASVSVTGGELIGGAVGYNYGEIEDCQVQGQVQCSIQGAGGFVGWNKGVIERSLAEVEVMGLDGTGGFAAVNEGTIRDCQATGDVTGATWVGGLVGWNNLGEDIIRSYATGNVTGEQWVGGLVGMNNGNVINCYAKGNVAGNEIVGGLTGENKDFGITHSYAAGEVTGNLFTGGLAGISSGTAINCYWDKDVSGQVSSAAGLGRTSKQMLVGTAGAFIKPDGSEDEHKNVNNLMYDGWEEIIWNFGSTDQYPSLE